MSRDDFTEDTPHGRGLRLPWVGGWDCFRVTEESYRARPNLIKLNWKCRKSFQSRICLRSSYSLHWCNLNLLQIEFRLEDICKFHWSHSHKHRGEQFSRICRSFLRMMVVGWLALGLWWRCRWWWCGKALSINERARDCCGWQEKQQQQEQHPRICLLRLTNNIEAHRQQKHELQYEITFCCTVYNYYVYCAKRRRRLDGAVLAVEGSLEQNLIDWSRFYRVLFCCCSIFGN